MRVSALIGLLVVTGALTLAPRHAIAQTATPAPTPPRQIAQLERDFFKNLLRDQKAIWTSPAHVRPGDIWWIGTVAGGTAAFLATDLKTGDWMAKYPELVDPSIAVSYAGAGYTVAAAAGTLYLVGRVAKNDRAAQTGLLAGEALISSFIVTSAIKGIAQRARPDAGDERSQFWVGGTSFPSGHASNVWSFATVVASEYKDQRIVPVVAYSLAGLVSVSRFTGQRHYMSDVLIGSAIGFGVGRYVYRVHHLDDIKRGSAVAGASNGGTGKWPLVSPQFDRATRSYRIGASWIY